MGAKPLANVYVDGFNLYKSLLQGAPELKWLDLRKFVALAISNYEIGTVHYFTASVKMRADPSDPRRPDRQDAYLRAIQHHGGVTVHRSQFSIQKGHARLVNPDERHEPIEWVPVWKVQEKGSDVNLAVNLLLDAQSRRADAYWVVSGDSDMLPAIEAAVDTFGARVGVLLARPAGRALRALHEQGKVSLLDIKRKHLLDAQLPDKLRNGRIVRPSEYH